MDVQPILLKEDADAGSELLAFMSASTIISEATSRRISATSSILCEGGKTASTYDFTMKGQYIKVGWSDFYKVYNDIDTHKTSMDIIKAFGLNPQGFDSTDRNEVGKHVRGMIKWFAKSYSKSYFLPEPKERNSIRDELDYTTLDSVPKKVENGVMLMDADGVAEDKGYLIPPELEDDEEEAGYLFEPGKSSINRGARGKDHTKTGKIVDNINKKELFVGDFYSNISRIPKQSVFHWVVNWKKDTVGLKGEKSTLLGKRWKKMFIVGYQVDNKLLYEIWFNTIDSTYSVHDKRGSELGRRAHSMFEAIRTMFLYLAKESPKDGEFLRNPFDKSLVNSFTTAMKNDVDKQTDDLMRREKLDGEKEKVYTDAIQKKADDANQKKADEIATAQKARDDFKRRVKASFSAENNVFRKTETTPDSEDDLAGFKKAGASVASSMKASYDKLDQMGKDSVKASNRNKEANIKAELARKKEEKARADAKRTNVAKKENRFVDFTGTDSEYVHPKQYTANYGIEGNKQKGITESGSEMGYSEYSDTKDELEEYLKGELQSRQYGRQVEKLKKDAERETATFRSIKKVVMSSIEKYYSSRTDRSFGSRFDMLFGSGRRDKIVLPPSKPGFFGRLKMALLGSNYRADFVVGYTVNDRVNMEIWYITEQNPEYDGVHQMKKTISSFYVFDVTSAKLIRKYIPYYRNAEQVILQKIGVGEI